MKALKYFALILTVVFTACSTKTNYTINEEILANLGAKYKAEFYDLAKYYEDQAIQFPDSIENYLGIADSYALLRLFGYVPEQDALPQMKQAYAKAASIDSLNSNVVKLQGMLHFIDRQWLQAEQAFKKSIAINPKNLNARHWYALWLSAMDRFNEAMAQSDTIMVHDRNDKFLVSRASFFYFQYRFKEMKPLMQKDISENPEVPWAYDWLAMAYNGLEQHDSSITTYLKAFELSDGTVEIGGGLGHALGDAGEIKLAKQMCDFYDQAAKDNYLPSEQRAFIHISIGEYDKALDLLEQAYNENSWFLNFMQTEHWYDSIRKDARFIAIEEKMEFPE